MEPAGLKHIAGDEGQRVINRAGFYRTDAEGHREYLVLPEAFRQEVCGGFDHKGAIQTLITGWLAYPCQRRQHTEAQAAGTWDNEGLRFRCGDVEGGMNLDFLDVLSQPMTKVEGHSGTQGTTSVHAGCSVPPTVPLSGTTRDNFSAPRRPTGHLSPNVPLVSRTARSPQSLTLCGCPPCPPMSPSK